MSKKETINTRVLIIDDEEMVRDNIEEILVPHKTQQNSRVSDALDLLFDEEIKEEEEKVIKDQNHFPDFRVDKAVNGREGLEHVKKRFRTMILTPSSS